MLGAAPLGSLALAASSAGAGSVTVPLLTDRRASFGSVDLRAAAFLTPTADATFEQPRAELA